MQDKSYVPFTEEMKREYTILVPNMLPMHFELIIRVLETYGYKMELLRTSGAQIAETGLRYTHNDACYPAVLVIGQFMDALLSGKYDPHKTALIMFQTGGGCRASNYISLIRKALKKAGMEYVPVISFSLAGLERHPGFRLSVRKLHRMLYAVLYGDLLMSLVNQVRPFEREKGRAEALAGQWTDRLGRELGETNRVSYRRVKANCREIVRSFTEVPADRRPAPRVGIVGEIFVKYSPLANNDLERFLIREGAQTVVPGLLDFCLYAVYNSLAMHDLYGGHWLRSLAIRPVWRFLNHKRDAVSRALTCRPEDNRIEIAFHIPNAAGTLITVLDTIAHYGVDMTEIHSRPLKDSPWCYVFYVDFTGNMRDHAVQSLLYQLHEELPYIKVIGSYHV